MEPTPDKKYAWIVTLDDDPLKCCVQKVRVVGFVESNRSAPDLLYQVNWSKYPRAFRGKYYFEEAPAQRELAAFCGSKFHIMKLNMKKAKRQMGFFKRKSTQAAKVYKRIEKSHA